MKSRPLKAYKSASLLPYWSRGEHVLFEDAEAAGGLFDIVGDVHGCLDELLELLVGLGYKCGRRAGKLRVLPPAGRRLVFVGDLVNRGPRSVEVLRLVMQMCRAGEALCVAGNQDMKLLGLLRKKSKTTENPGVMRALLQLGRESAAFRAEAERFLDALPGYLMIDGGRLLVAHTGLREELHGQRSAMARRVAVFGETTEELDSYGRLKRVDWAASYSGKTVVVFGHTPQQSALWRNNTINVDTGCVYGGRLTAFLYPEMSTASVAAHACHWSRPQSAPKGPSRKLAK